MTLVGPSPIPGDLIEFFRRLYQHWGIYVGDGYVVHLTDQEGFSSFSSISGATAAVRKERLEKVVHGCKYRVNNKHDKDRTPNPPGKVVKAALEEVGKQMPYSVTSGNCEHFVTNLRYGDCLSDQVDKALKYTAVGGAVAIVAGALAVCAVITVATKNKKQRKKHGRP